MGTVWVRDLLRNQRWVPSGRVHQQGACLVATNNLLVWGAGFGGDLPAYASAVMLCACKGSPLLRALCSLPLLHCQSCPF